jgi:membrane-associated phospholipid phosphatase
MSKTVLKVAGSEPGRASGHDARHGASVVAPVRPDWAYPKRGLAIALRWPLLMFVLGSAAIATVDGPIARYDFPNSAPRQLMAVVNHAEVFGNGVCVVFFLTAVWLLDPARRRMIPRLACASWGAGIAANLVKLCVTRERPYRWLETGAATIGEQFGGWFPLAGNPSMHQSFPSAHTATAVGLALGLTALYPRGGKLFGLLAALVAMQRAAGDMHFVSDTLFAAGIALLTGLALYRWPPLVRAFERFEAAAAAADAVPSTVIPSARRRAA